MLAIVFHLLQRWSEFLGNESDQLAVSAGMSCKANNEVGSVFPEK